MSPREENASGEVRDDAFLQFIHPSGPAVANLPLHLFYLVAFVFLDVYMSLAPSNSAASYPRVLMACCYAMLAFGCLMSIFAVVPQLIGYGDRVSLLLRLKVAEAALCICAVGVLVGELGAIYAVIERKCVGNNYAYVDDRRVFRHANCADRFHLFGSLVLVVAVLKRVRFAAVAVTSMTMSIILAALLAYAPESDRTEVTVGHVLTAVALFSLISYFRYVLEQSEKQHFEITLRLTESAAILTERRGALEARMKEMLPPTIVERSSHRSSLLMKNDTSSEAVLWVMGVADFTVEASKVTQVDMAMKLSRLQVGVTEYLQRSTSLQRVSVMLDEITAVGNLLSKSKVPPCVVSACSAGQHVVSQLGGRLPLRVAVDVGHATGCFVGTRWIRYEVTGEAVTTARSALAFCTAGGVLVTDTALEAARDFLDVEDGPEMQLLHENDLGASIRSARAGLDYSDNIGGLTWSQLHLLRRCYPATETESAEPCTDSSGTSQAQFISSKSSELFHINRVVHYSNPDQTPAEQKGPVISAGDSGQPIVPETSSFDLKRTWFVFHVFADPKIEKDFAATRQRFLVRRAANLWRAYAAFMVLSLLILISDLREPHGVLAVVMITAAAAMATVVAVIPYLWPHSANTWHNPWFFLTLATQLTFVYGLAFSRPAAIGNDTRHTLIVGALLRGPVFKYARHQLIVTPLMFIAGVLQFLLPGGILQSPTYAVLGVVLFTMFADAEVDLAQRHRFMTSRQIMETLKLLDEEAKVREGLLRLTLPVPVKSWMDDLERSGEKLGLARWNTVPDTVVVAATYLPVHHNSTGKRRRSSALESQHRRVKPTINPWSVLEEVAAESMWLEIVSISGDTCLLLSPVTMVELPTLSQLEDQERLMDLLQFLTTVEDKDPNFRLIAEIDATTQVILTQSLPVFLAMGVGVTRTLAINAAADSALRGAIVTERVAQRFSACGTLLGSSCREQPFPPWSVRGVGITRLIRLVTE